MGKKEFFKLVASTETTIIGNKFPQVVGTIKKYNNSLNNPLSIFSFAHRKGECIDYVPDLNGIKLATKARVTDLISCYLGPGNDLVVSDKYLNILKSFSTSNFQIFKCSLNRGEDVYSYNWLHFNYDLYDKIDYTGTCFVHNDIELESMVKQIKSYNSLQEFYKRYDKHELLRATTTVLNCAPLDFFIVGEFNQNIYLSKRLMEISLLENISGVEYQVADDILFLKSE